MKEGMEIQLVIIKGAEKIVMMKTNCEQGSANTPTWHIFWTWKTKDQILKAAQNRRENVWRCPDKNDFCSLCFGNREHESRKHTRTQRNESFPLKERWDLEPDVSQVCPSKGLSKKHLESWELEAKEASGSQGETEAAGTACPSSRPHNPRPNFMGSFWGGLLMPAKYPLGEEVQALLV